MSVKIRMKSDQFKRLQMMISEIKDGSTSEDIFEDVFLETKKDDNNPWRTVALIVTHLFKIKFSKKDDFKYLWKTDHISHHRGMARSLLKWGTDEERTDLINKMKSDIQIIYGMGIHYYTQAAKDYDDLVVDEDLFPPTCPWTLDELMEDNVDDLLNMI